MRVAAGAGARRRLGAAALDRLAGWAGDYDGAARKDEPGPLLAIGRDIALFLNSDDAWLDRALQGVGKVALEIAVPANPAEEERYEHGDFTCWVRNDPP